MDTALYYTFSTIAQALAAAMALLAAFAMYRLNAIEAECMGGAEVVDRIMGGGLDLRRHFAVFEWSKFLAALKASSGSGSPISVAMTSRIERLQAASKRIKLALWVSLALTALVMGGSVAALAYVPVICSTGNARTALGFGVALFVVCLLAYGWLIFESLRVPKLPAA
jgi:hypothetical protein